VPPETSRSAGLAKRLGRIELADWRGESVQLGSLWRERPVVLVFIRHFG